MNATSTLSAKQSKSAVAAPKYVDHEELHGRWAQRRLFAPAWEGKTQGSVASRDLSRFKRMHFCARRMTKLTERYGEAAAVRDDYKRFTELFRRLRDEIAANNLGLVYDLYKKSWTFNVDGDELLSSGMRALARAIETFNPWRGFRFSTYACTAIIRAFYRCGREEAKRRRHEPVYFDSHLERGDRPDTSCEQDLMLYTERLSKILANGCGGLTSIEKDVLSQRFPLVAGAPGWTLSELGRKMHLSKERVRQIQNSALAKLRLALEADPVLM